MLRFRSRAWRTAAARRPPLGVGLGRVGRRRALEPFRAGVKIVKVVQRARALVGRFLAVRTVPVSRGEHLSRGVRWRHDWLLGVVRVVPPRCDSSDYAFCEFRALMKHR